MPKCINDITKSFKGDEPSPKGLGYSASSEEIGTVMAGKDGNNWRVIQTKNCKRWVKINTGNNIKKKRIDFDNLDENCYIDAYIPNIDKQELHDETGLEEKFGGTKPFFIEGESWPIVNNHPIKLVCQFKNPMKKDNILIRIFSDIDEECQNDDPIFKILNIELNEENLKKQTFLNAPSFDKIYKGYEIKGWTPAKELKPLAYIMNKFGYDKIPCKYHNNYYDSQYLPSNGIKVGGTSMYCQYSSGDKEAPNNFLQLIETNYLPYGWGDAGIAHLDENGNLEWDCF